VPEFLEMWIAADQLIIIVRYTSHDRDRFQADHPGLVYEDEIQRLVECAETRGNTQ